MPQENNSKMETYLTNTVFIATASTDLTTNIARRLKQLSGEMTARFKAIITSAGTSN